MELVGYARVSTRDQDLGLQIEKLESYGCKKIFMEKQSGAKSDREELNTTDISRSLNSFTIFCKSNVERA
ncbi:recombinase family protein, partial [Bacillus sp. HC-Mk]